MTILIPGYRLHHLRKDRVGKRGEGVAINAHVSSVFPQSGFQLHSRFAEDFPPN